MKRDSATQQHTSKQQEPGKTESPKEVVPDWHLGPKDLSKKEDLRRRYKKLFGFKPCGLGEKELERVVLATEEEREFQRRGAPNLMDPQSRATIGDALKQKR